MHSPTHEGPRPRPAAQREFGGRKGFRLTIGAHDAREPERAPGESAAAAAGNGAGAVAAAVVQTAEPAEAEPVDACACANASA